MQQALILQAPGKSRTACNWIEQLGCPCSKTFPFFADGRVGAGLRHLHGQPLAERNQKQLCAVTSASITPVTSSQSCSAFSLSARLNSSDIGCGISAKLPLSVTARAQQNPPAASYMNSMDSTGRYGMSSGQASSKRRNSSPPMLIVYCMQFLSLAGPSLVDLALFSLPFG